MIHKFSMNGVNVVMDINSGAVHVASDVMYDIVDKYNDMDKSQLISEFSSKYSSEMIEEAIEEIEFLKKEEMLFTPDYYEGVLPQVNQRNPVVKALCLHIAHDCNLKCKYCFAE